MVSIMEIMQFCRLCLVKEQVNVPIFDEQEDIRQICEKITSCLPVKVSKEDELPKKICDGCLYKLELQYQFYNSTANAEKQLLTWLEQAKMDSKNSSSEITTSQTTVKQEKVEPIESTNEITEITEITTDPQSYMQQYQTDFQYKDSQVSNADIDANVSSNSDEPLAKRARRRRQASKPIPREVIESSDENDAGDSMMEMTVTKTEEESESDNEENVDDPEPAKYAAAGEDTEQPGPSGLGKGGTDAPEKTLTKKTPKRRIRGKRRRLHKCTVCHKSAETLEDLNSHFATHELKYDCQICQERFRCLFQCSLHMSKHDYQDFTCCMCSFFTDKKACLLQHINNIHLKKYLYYCGECGKGFNSKSDKFEHEVLHKGVKPHVCVVCDKKFSYTRNLLEHQLTYHSAMISGAYLENQCSICKKVFGKKSTLENHIHVKHDLKLKPHMCDKCGKCFSTNTKLILHYRTHTGFKPFGCEFCKKCFRTKELLNEHVRIHTGEKPFSCEYCGKCFNQRTPLRVHTRIHTGEKPYVCQFCAKGFTSKGGLTIHMKCCTGVKVKQELYEPEDTKYF